MVLLTETTEEGADEQDDDAEEEDVAVPAPPSAPAPDKEAQLRFNPNQTSYVA